MQEHPRRAVDPNAGADLAQLSCVIIEDE